MHSSVSEYLNPFTLSGVKLFNLEPLEICKNLQFLSTSPYYYPATNTCCESLRTYISVMQHIAQSKSRHLQIKSQISMGLALQLVLTKVMAIAMFMFFARAVVQARQISRTNKKS